MNDESDAVTEHPKFVRWVLRRSQNMQTAILILMIVTLPVWLRLLELWHRLREWYDGE